MEGTENKDRVEIYSKVVRAGKRTYFFDVRATKSNEYYLTLTESKKKMDNDGNFHFEKHKIFLYKEDFERFMDNLNETVNFINTENGSAEIASEKDGTDYTNVDFPDFDTDKV